MSADIYGEIHADGKTLVLLPMAADAHEIDYAAALLTTLTPRFDDSVKSIGTPGGWTTGLSWPAVVQLHAAFGTYWQPGPYLAGWIEDQFRRRYVQDPQLYVPPPPGLTPYPWQITAAAMMRELGGCLLWDEPGCGKTAATILGLVERAAQGFPVLPVVVVAPNSVVDIWVEEIQRWAPFWHVIAWRGSPKRRRKLAGTADIYVCSYGVAVQDAGEMATGKHQAEISPLLALRPRFVVGDEVHKIKDQATQQSNAVRRIAKVAAQFHQPGFSAFTGLSGTPITHTPGDSWPALEALEPLAYPSRDRWVTHFCHFVRKDYSVDALGLAEWREPEFRLTIQGQARRIAKADVLKELPPKVYSKREVELPPVWRKAYDSMAQDMLAQLPDGGELPVMSVLAQLSRLAQLASAAADVHTTTEEVWDPDLGEHVEKERVHVTLKEPSWKVDALMEIMEERPGRPIVAFAPSAQLIRLAGQRAAKKGYRVGWIIGDKGGGRQQTMAERTAYREAFQRGELDLICVTTGAGGVGITLTRSDCAVFLQRPWSLVEATQSEDRLHRIGAGHESIDVIDIIAKGTIDSRVRQVLKTRAGQLSDFVKDPRIVAEILGGASVSPLKRSKAA